MKEAIGGILTGLSLALVIYCVSIVSGGPCVPGEALSMCSYCPKSGWKALATPDYPFKGN